MNFLFLQGDLARSVFSPAPLAGGGARSQDRLTQHGIHPQRSSGSISIRAFTRETAIMVAVSRVPMVMMGSAIFSAHCRWPVGSNWTVRGVMLSPGCLAFIATTTYYRHMPLVFHLNYSCPVLP